MANVRINISMDEEILARLDAFADAHGMTRSALLTIAATQYMEATDKAPIAQMAASEMFSIMSDMFRAGYSTADLEQRTAALEQKLEALK